MIAERERVGRAKFNREGLTLFTFDFYMLYPVFIEYLLVRNENQAISVKYRFDTILYDVLGYFFTHYGTRIYSR